MLLVFISEEEAYEAITKMISFSATQELIGKYILMSHNEIGIIGAIVSKVIKKMSPELGSFFEEKKYLWKIP